MPKYRKKPVIIDAFQMTEARRWDNSEWPQWLHEAWNKEPSENAIWIDDEAPIAEGHESAAELVCGTLEGVHRISWGDYIIQGIQGEIYPCKPDIFAESYEQVKQDNFQKQASRVLPEVGKPVPDSMPTTKRLLEKPHGEVGFEVVGNKIVERWDIPESFAESYGEGQGLSDVARCKTPAIAQELCDLLNDGRKLKELSSQVVKRHDEGNLSAIPGDSQSVKRLKDYLEG